MQQIALGHVRRVEKLKEVVESAANKISTVVPSPEDLGDVIDHVGREILKLKPIFAGTYFESPLRRAAAYRDLFQACLVTEELDRERLLVSVAHLLRTEGSNEAEIDNLIRRLMIDESPKP